MSPTRQARPSDRKPSNHDSSVCAFSMPFWNVSCVCGVCEWLINCSGEVAATGTARWANVAAQVMHFQSEVLLRHDGDVEG